MGVAVVSIERTVAAVGKFTYLFVDNSHVDFSAGTTT